MEEEKKIPREEQEEKNEEEEEEPKKKSGLGFWLTAIIIYCLLFAVGFFFLSEKKVMIIGEWNLGWAIFFAQIIYTILSFKQVGPTELGAKLFFGKPIQEVKSGLVFVPFLIFKLEKETRLTMQDELPGDPEKIYRGDGEAPEGMFPPIRIPFADKSAGDDPLNRRVTAEIVPIIRWRISYFVKFLTTIGSREAAKKQMEDATIGLCMRDLTQLSVAEALVGLKKFNEELGTAIRKMVEKWGISLETAQIKQINFHHSLNDAISSVPEAEFKAKVTVRTAEAEKRKRMLEGQGSGDAEKAVINGRTEGFKTMRDELELTSDLVLSAETARAITQNPGQKTVIVGAKGFSDLIGIVTGIGKTLKDD